MLRMCHEVASMMRTKKREHCNRKCERRVFQDTWHQCPCNCSVTPNSPLHPHRRPEEMSQRILVSLPLNWQAHLLQNARLRSSKNMSFHQKCVQCLPASTHQRSGPNDPKSSLQRSRLCKTALKMKSDATAGANVRARFWGRPPRPRMCALLTLSCVSMLRVICDTMSPPTPPRPAPFGLGFSISSRSLRTSANRANTKNTSRVLHSFLIPHHNNQQV